MAQSQRRLCPTMKSRPESGWLFSGSHAPKELGGSRLRAGLVTYFDGMSYVHAWQRPIDALHDATGPWLSRVTISGTVHVVMGKIKGCQRTCLDVADASGLLERFACWCARRVAHVWDPPLPVLRYLESADPQHRFSASSTVRNLAPDRARRVTSSTLARWSAVWAATIDCPRYAAKFASEDAARASAWYRARKSEELDVYSTTMAIESNAQNEHLTAEIDALLGK